MKRIDDIRELREIQMGILDYVHGFCEQHGIVYFLSSGSLLGAVRHGGYIPWDDDIDIYVPRKEYERLLHEFENTSQYRLLDPSKEPHYYYTFAKVVDLRTRMVEKETEGYEIGVYIDIFPVDYLPDDEAERLRLFRRKKLLYKIRRCKISSSNPLHSRLAYWFYKWLPVSVDWLTSMIHQTIVCKHPSQYACNMTEAGPHVKHCFPARDMDSQVDIKFEDRVYKTMVGYRDYLEHTYGDYMTLPPVEQRDTHQFEAWWK